jgi:hypothetical protein
MRLLHCALALLAVLVMAGVSHGEFYKWTDERGQIHLSDDYYKVPPKYRSGVEVKKAEEHDSGVGEAPPLGSETQQGPTEPSYNEPTSPTGGGEAGGWQDWSGRGPDYWSSRQNDLRAKVEDLKRRVLLNKEAIDKLSSTRAAYIGGRRQRALLEAENERLEQQLAETRKMLDSGLAEEALRSGVPPEFANSLRGI